MSSNSSTIRSKHSKNSKIQAIRRLKSSPSLADIQSISPSKASDHEVIYMPTKILILDKLSKDCHSKVANELIDLLKQQLGQKMRVTYFSEFIQLLRSKYGKEQRYFIVVNQDIVKQCSRFVKQERQMNPNNVKIRLVCIFQNLQNYQEAQTRLLKKQRQNISFSHYFGPQDKSNCIANAILKVCEKESVTKVSGLCSYTPTNSPSKSSFATQNSPDRSDKEHNTRSIHIICQGPVYSMLSEYFNETGDNSITVSSFSSFEDLVLLSKRSSTVYTKSLKNNNHYSMKDFRSEYLPSQSFISDQRSMNCINLIESYQKYKIQAQSMKIIICPETHKQIQKIKALVNTGKGKIIIWQISGSSPNILSRLKKYLSLNRQSQKPSSNKNESDKQYKKVKRIYCKKNEDYVQKQPGIPLKIHIDKQIVMLSKFQRMQSSPFSLIYKVNQKIPLKQNESIPFIPKQQINPIEFCPQIIDNIKPSVQFLQKQITCDIINPVDCTILQQIKQNMFEYQILSPRKQDQQQKLCLLSGITDNFSQFENISISLILNSRKEKINQFTKILFYKIEEKIIIETWLFDNFLKIQYQGWKDLFEMITLQFKEKQKWISCSQRSTNEKIVKLSPSLYLQNKVFMKEFAYFNVKEIQKSSQVFYHSEIDLTSKLMDDPAPGVVIYSCHNQKWIKSLKSKFGDKYQWYELQDEFWIDENGNIVKDSSAFSVITKIQSYLNNFNSQIFENIDSVQFCRTQNQSLGWDLIYEQFTISAQKIKVLQQRQLINQIKNKQNILFVIFLEKQSQIFNNIDCAAKPTNIKFIYLNEKFQNNQFRLFIKYSQIVPLIIHTKKIFDTKNKDLVIYPSIIDPVFINEIIKIQQLIQPQQCMYVSIWPDIQLLFNKNRGFYRKSYVICKEEDLNKISQLAQQTLGSSQQIILKPLQSWTKQKEEKPENIYKSSFSNSETSKISAQLQIESNKHTPSITQMTPQNKSNLSLPIESRDDNQQCPVKHERYLLSLDSFDKICVVYQQHMDMQQKRQLLAACTQNQKIVPVLYNSISQIKKLQLNQTNLILLMMKQVPMELYNQLVQKELNIEIVFKGKLKVLLPKFSDINLRSISDLLQFSRASAIKKIKNQQVSQCLNKFESQVLSRNNSYKTEKNQTQMQEKASEQSQNQIIQQYSDYIIKKDRQIKPPKKDEKKYLAVLIVEFQKKEKLSILAAKLHMIMQTYTNQSSLETEIRKRVAKHTIFCVISTELAGKAKTLKNKYEDQIFFFLQQTKNIKTIDQNDRYIVQQFSKIIELEKSIQSKINNQKKQEYAYKIIEKQIINEKAHELLSTNQSKGSTIQLKNNFLNCDKKLIKNFSRAKEKIYPNSKKAEYKKKEFQKEQKVEKIIQNKSSQITKFCED